MENEREFFERLVNVGQDNWDVKLQPHMAPGSIDLASYTAMLYLVDTSTGWTAAGAIQPSGFAASAKAHKKQGFSGNQIKDMIGNAIVVLGQSRPNSDAPQVARAFQMAAAALTTTKTFEMVKPSGLEGHWVYMGYRLFDGSTQCRPGFFRNQKAGFADPAELDTYVRHVIAQDTGNPNSAAGRSLKKGGGAILAPMYKA